MVSTPDDRFRQLFDAHHGSVLAYTMRRSASIADAEDAAAETFTVAWRRRDDIPADPLPWLYAVARRVLANQHRGARRWSRVRGHLGSAARDAPARTEGGPATIALGRLRPDDQELLRLVAWEDMTHGQIAAMLGISVNAVAIRLHRARGRFAEQLRRTRDADLKGSVPDRTSGVVKGAVNGDWHEETR